MTAIYSIFFLFLAGSTPSLPEIGLDIAMKELDQLDGELDILKTNKENNLLLSEDVFLGKFNSICVKINSAFPFVHREKSTYL